MDNLFVNKTQESPKIEFNPINGYLLIEGRSIPENSIELYEPLLSLLSEYAKNPIPITEINFKFEYFNTSSSKCIFIIIKQLEEINTKNTEVVINWFYDEDDDEMLEIGQDYSQFTSIAFNLKKISKN